MIKQKRKICFTLFLGFFVVVNFFLFGFVQAEDIPSLTDPLKNRDIPDLVGGIIQYVLGIIGILALVMFIYGGILWMTSGGSAEKIKKGKDTIVWAVLGLAIVFLSYAIVNFVLKAFV